MVEEVLEHLFDGLIISTEDDRKEQEEDYSDWLVPDLYLYAKEGVVLDEFHSLQEVPEDLFCHSLRTANSWEADLDHIEELFFTHFTEFVKVQVVYDEFGNY